MHIVQTTPTPVWLMLAGLVAFTLVQARPRTIGAARDGLLPVALAMQPKLAGQAGFAPPLSFAFGLFSSVFAARGLQLWRARRAPRPRLA